ncbi:MAG: hypothetical protein ACRDYA_10075 [Egibacteraceae bacterium]
MATPVSTETAVITCRPGVVLGKADAADGARARGIWRAHIRFPGRRG